jgi:hypothetical protein
MQTADIGPKMGPNKGGENLYREHNRDNTITVKTTDTETTIETTQKQQKQLLQGSQ